MSLPEPTPPADPNADPRAAFAAVRAWVFDLDNTLYPPEIRLFAQIEARMRDWMARSLGLGPAEADALRAAYWREHGTTLAGLMAEHSVDPLPWLTEVHDIDFSALTLDPALAKAISALPGRRIVYTNGSEPYARRVLEGRGLAGCFDAVYGIEHAGFRPKPEQAAFEAVFALDGLRADQGAMFEDVARNLAAPHALGMRTVLVGPLAPGAAEAEPHIHFRTDRLAAFLTRLV